MPLSRIFWDQGSLSEVAKHIQDNDKQIVHKAICKKFLSQSLKYGQIESHTLIYTIKVHFLITSASDNMNDSSEFAEGTLVYKEEGQSEAHKI